MFRKTSFVYWLVMPCIQHSWICPKNGNEKPTTSTPCHTMLAMICTFSGWRSHVEHSYYWFLCWLWTLYRLDSWFPILAHSSWLRTNFTSLDKTEVENKILNVAISREGLIPAAPGGISHKGSKAANSPRKGLLCDRGVFLAIVILHQTKERLRQCHTLQQHKEGFL